jgi:hypothetical protein
LGIAVDGPVDIDSPVDTILFPGLCGHHHGLRQFFAGVNTTLHVTFIGDQDVIDKKLTLRAYRSNHAVRCD